MYNNFNFDRYLLLSDLLGFDLNSQVGYIKIKKSEIFLY